MSKEELVDLVSFRGERFGAVSAVFARESSEEALAQTVAFSRKYAEELDDGSAEAALGKDLSLLRIDDFSCFATLTRTEYARLFLGPREVVAPLHESAYLSGSKRMFTAETLRVRSFYAKHGYAFERKNKEPEDGVSTELEFLRALCDRCVALLESDGAEYGEILRLLQAQRDFVHEHLGRWVDNFSELVAQNDRSGYYAAWARYLNRVMGEDVGMLDRAIDLLGELCRSV